MLIQASHDWFFFEPREQLEVGVQILQIGKPTAGKTELSGNWKKTVLPDFDGVPAWSADGTSLYCMSSTRENGNMLRRISFPDLIEEKRMHFDPISEVSLIGETKAGLVLNLRGKGAIWIIDPRTFEMVRKIDVLCNVKPSAFAISPGSDSIFVPARDCLLTIDAASGTVETAISFKSFPKSVYLPRYEEVELVSRRSGELLIAKTKSHLVEFAISAGKLSVSSSLSIERARGRPKWEPSGDVMTIPTVWALFPEQVTKSANPNYDSSKRGLYLVGEKDVTKPTGVYEGSAMIYRAPDGQSLHALSSEGLQILELNGQVRETIEFKNRFDRRGIPKAHPSLDVIAIGQKNGHSGMRIIQRVP